MQADSRARDVSVVVCTRNRASQLPPFFASLKTLRVEGLRAELILVDNNSSDDTFAVLRQQSSVLPFHEVEVYRVAGPLCAAKNAGIARARGEIVAFTDDDCYPDPDWLEKIVQFFSENPGVHVVGGDVRLFDEADFPITITHKEIVAPRMTPEQALWASVHGCNLSVRRHTLLEVGGFDEKLGPGTAARATEDRDVIYRIARRYGGFNYEPGIRISHHHRRRNDADIQALMSTYRIGEDAFWYKYASKRDFRVARMVAKVVSWRFDRSRMAKPILILRVLSSMVAGYFRGRTAYRHQRNSHVA